MAGRYALPRFLCAFLRRVEDKDWTKEETDYLFALSVDYDLRWYIIHDRYEYPDATRSMEVSTSVLVFVIDGYVFAGLERPVL